MVKFVPTIVLINPFSALFGPYYFPFFDAMSHQWTERRLRGSYTDPIRTIVPFFVRIVFFLPVLITSEVAAQYNSRGQ